MKIDGGEIANQILKDLKKKVENLKLREITPHLAIILVGDNPQSKSYVEQKELKGNKIGVKTSIYKLPNSISTRELVSRLNDLNHLSKVHGIIVQRPLPSHIDSKFIDQAVNTNKDVDGFNPNTKYTPPIVSAVFAILEHIFSSNKENEQSFENFLRKKRIVVIGKGETAGGPIIKEFKKLNINHQVIDSKTHNPKLITHNSDIIISAVGKPNIITPENIKRGVIVISVGLYKGNDGKLHGDYDEEKIKDLASFYTPTPGGVGPVNVAFLLKNLVEATEDLSRSLL